MANRLDRSYSPKTQHRFQDMPVSCHPMGLPDTSSKSVGSSGTILRPRTKIVNSRNCEISYPHPLPPSTIQTGNGPPPPLPPKSDQRVNARDVINPPGKILTTFPNDTNDVGLLGMEPPTSGLINQTSQGTFKPSVAMKPSASMNGSPRSVQSALGFHFPVENVNSNYSLKMNVVTMDGIWSERTMFDSISPASQFSPNELKISSLLDSHDRFKPDRSQRRPVQKLKWGNSKWGTLAGDLFSCSYSTSPIVTSSSISCQGTPSNNVNVSTLPVESESRVSSMTIADVSPRLAVKKVLILYEHAQYREAANFINRLSIGTFRIILRELPMDVFVEAMPHSLPIIEALYAKVFCSDGSSANLKPLKPESILMHIVKFFSREDVAQNRNRETVGSFTSGSRNILKVIVVGEPKLMKNLHLRIKILDKTVEGMGQHGLVGTTDESLTSLHDALKIEFRRVVGTYKEALQKLEDLALLAKSNPKSVAHGPAPINASHQRQLSLKCEDIQDRLIKNKSLLNVVEPTLENHCMDILLGILERRIELDKEALFQFTQLKKEAGDVSNEQVVAPLLMRYSRGCKQVLEIMRDIAKEVGACVQEFEDDSSDLSGYHSDSDSAIMTSGNSPYVTPRARYNFLSRSVRSKHSHRPSLLEDSTRLKFQSPRRSLSAGSSPCDSSSSITSGLLEADVFSSANFPLTSTPSPQSQMNEGTSTSGLRSSLSAAAPTRPRHIKLRNQLHKNNSLVSNGSTGSETSSGCGSGDSEELKLSHDAVECVECVTVVSVPDNQVISQGANHRCPKTNITKRKLVESELRSEVARLKERLSEANKTIDLLQESSKFIDASGMIEKSPGLRDLTDEVDRRTELTREYGALYAQNRVEAMDSLDSLPQLAEADELKSKLLFSVVVLSFRAVQTRLSEIKTQVANVLHLNDTGLPIHNRLLMESCAGSTDHVHQDQLLQALNKYLHYCSYKVDQGQCVEKVATQLWQTLYDYPCLKKCDGLIKYITACVNVAWTLSIQNPPCMLEYETKNFHGDYHVRFHCANQTTDVIKTYIWPTLLEALNGPCLHKGIVIT